MTYRTHRGAFRSAATAASIGVIIMACAPGAMAMGSVSTVAARPMGLGGAFLAVEDEVAGISWNPAAFAPVRCNRTGGFRFHLNVLGAPAIARETGLLTGVERGVFEDLPAAEKMSVAVGSVVKSASYYREGFAVGVLMLEENLDPSGLRESKGLADARDLLNAYYSSACVVFRLSPTVSIGASETIYARLDSRGRRHFGAGRSYGALLKPNEAVTVGLVYIDVPPEYEGYRRGIEGFDARTMNAGISYRPLHSLLLTLDVRDLAEKHPETALSSRAGVEWSLWGKLALRAGYYREETTDSNVMTVGLGAIPMPGCRLRSGDARSDLFVLNYAAMISESSGPMYLLSVVLHF